MAPTAAKMITSATALTTVPGMSRDQRRWRTSTNQTIAIMTSTTMAAPRRKVPLIRKPASVMARASIRPV
jgi:hypothetical protein